MWTTRVRPRTYKLITLICCNTNANTILAREGEGAKTWPRPGQTDYNSCAWIHITRNPSHNVMSHKKIIQFLIWKPTWSSHHKHEPISEPNESHQEEVPLHQHHHPTWHHQSALSSLSGKMRLFGLSYLFTYKGDNSLIKAARWVFGAVFSEFMNDWYWRQILPAAATDTSRTVYDGRPGATPQIFDLIW